MRRVQRRRPKERKESVTAPIGGKTAEGRHLCSSNIPLSKDMLSAGEILYKVSQDC
jgi:hypothetical protein